MEYIAVALAIGAIYSLIAVGFALIFSILGFSNFSHGVIMACGAYIGYYVMAGGWPWYAALFCSAVGCGILGMLVEFFAFRRLRIKNGPIIYLFVASITVLMLIENILTLRLGGWILAYPPLFNKMTFAVGGIRLPVTFFLILGVSLVSLLVLNLFLKKTKAGVAIRAASSDLRACSLMGIRINLLISLVFFIAGALGGCAGMFYAINYSLYPQIGRVVVKGYMSVVIGGMGSLGGAVAGAFLIASLETLMTFLAGSSYSPIGLFLVVVAFLLVRPQGIAGVSREQKA